jgi:soluble lytic murein transglycosylase
VAIAACLLAGAVNAAPTLTSLARAYRDKPSPATKAALVQFANDHAKDQDGALALLALGATAVENGQYGDAAYSLKAIGKRLPKLADYSAWWLGLAQFNLEDYQNAWDSLSAAYIAKSPIASRAAIVAARAYTQAGQPRQALDLLRQNYDRLPQPEGDYALATTFEAANDFINAVSYHQRVFYGFPLAPEAAKSEDALSALKAKLGANFPPELPQAALGRALKLLEKKQAARAQAELRALVGRVGGLERDLARVRIGVADFVARRYAAAVQYLKPLDVAGEADAERLRTIALSALKLNDVDGANAAIAELTRKYPDSKWRLEALSGLGDYHFRRNNVAEYEAAYKACATGFPKEIDAAHCQWRIAFLSYWKRRPDAGDLMRLHVAQWPNSPDAPAALYFLGRWSEQEDDPASARVYYETINNHWPHFYYGMSARRRMEMPALARAQGSPKATEFVKGLKLPAREKAPNFTPESATKQRIERADLLNSAALDEYAERELMFGAEQGEQPHVLAMQLAELNTRRGQPDRGLRFVKRYAPGYLYYPYEAAPTQFWKYAYPMPFRTDLEKHAKAQGVDPFILAGLIRQESEFNPRAVSRASARGLTQVMPATGQELSRRLSIKPYSTPRLFEPAVNLQLGSFYLKNMLSKWENRWEMVLAAYNAGPGRAVEWNGFGEFREPAEFIEIVPFNETHDYIQIVLRNGEFYRRLYSGTAPEPEEVTAAPAKPAAKASSVAAKPTPKATTKTKSKTPAKHKRSGNAG